MSKCTQWYKFEIKKILFPYNSDKQEICKSLESGMEFLSDLIKRANQLDGYHVKNKQQQF